VSSGSLPNAGEIAGRLNLGVSLLDNPAELEARIAELREDSRFNPETFSVTLLSLFSRPFFLQLCYLPLSLKHKKDVL